MRKVMAIIIIIMVASSVIATADVAMALGHFFHHGGHGGGHGGSGGGGHGGCIPEIGPSVASSAVALLICDLLILTSRFGRK